MNVIENFDLYRYMGKWYEIARFDHRFERGMEQVTAEYSFRLDGLVRVLNCGYLNKNGLKKVCAEGKARLAKDGKPGRLRVSFFWFLYSDYDILELASDYSWALIGSSKPTYLWILSRTPHLDSITLNKIVEKARKRGYDVSKLIYVRQ